MPGKSMFNKEYYKLKRDFYPIVVPSVDFIPDADDPGGFNIQQNEPYPDPFGVELPLAQADEKDMKGMDFLKQFMMNQGIA